LDVQVEQPKADFSLLGIQNGHIVGVASEVCFCTFSKLMFSIWNR